MNIISTLTMNVEKTKYEIIPYQGFLLTFPRN
jgi:hypothetical protein